MPIFNVLCCACGNPFSTEAASKEEAAEHAGLYCANCAKAIGANTVYDVIEHRLQKAENGGNEVNEEKIELFGPAEVKVEEPSVEAMRVAIVDRLGGVSDTAILTAIYLLVLGTHD